MMTTADLCVNRRVSVTAVHFARDRFRPARLQARIAVQPIECHFPSTRRFVTVHSRSQNQFPLRNHQPRQVSTVNGRSAIALTEGLPRLHRLCLAGELLMFNYRVCSRGL